MQHDSCICNMTHSYMACLIHMWHDSHICDMHYTTDSQRKLSIAHISNAFDSFMTHPYGVWLIHDSLTRYMTQSQRELPMANISTSFALGSFMYDRMHSCMITQIYTWHGVLMTCPHVTWLIDDLSICDMTHWCLSHMWHVSFMTHQRVTWLIYDSLRCDMWHDALTTFWMNPL